MVRSARQITSKTVYWDSAAQPTSDHQGGDRKRHEDREREQPHDHRTRAARQQVVYPVAEPIARTDRAHDASGSPIGPAASRSRAMLAVAGQSGAPVSPDRPFPAPGP